MTEDPGRHLGLLFRVVNRSIRPGENRRELESVGYLGLHRAAQLYMPGRATFATYATQAVEWAIRNWRRKEYLFRHPAPPPQGPKRATLPRRYLLLFSEFGGDFVRGRNRVFAVVSPGFDAHLFLLDGRELIKRLLRKLTARCRDVIILRYGLGRGRVASTLDEAGKILGMTRERVRQLEAKGLGTLRSLARGSTFDGRPLSVADWI